MQVIMEKGKANHASGVMTVAHSVKPGETRLSYKKCEK